MRKVATQFFVKFYVTLIMYFVLMYFFDLNNWVVLITGLFILPQVVHTAIRGTSPGFNNKYIFGVIGTNIIYPVCLFYFIYKLSSIFAVVKRTSEVLNHHKVSALFGWVCTFYRSFCFMSSISLGHGLSSQNVSFPNRSSITSKSTQSRIRIL